MHNTILMIFMMVLGTVRASAQFYTITKESGIKPSQVKETAVPADNKGVTVVGTAKEVAKDTLSTLSKKQNHNSLKARNSDNSASLKTESRNNSLPTLTIPNLYAEILRNGILYPKVVLAQAILETGWFRSSVCLDKHNLFGLTNPRTGKYYEFEHWTESVRAYYTKVQYKYKGGNYLLWLRDIRYAEDPEYIRSVIRVLKQL
ncbi:MAG: glucosaminidase domain-containing protein [Bacteroidales bacterium]|nr:glucosaminidase domain-containing protein [Bacteroidales bacterium]